MQALRGVRPEGSADRRGSAPERRLCAVFRSDHHHCIKYERTRANRGSPDSRCMQLPVQSKVVVYRTFCDMQATFQIELSRGSRQAFVPTRNRLRGAKVQTSQPCRRKALALWGVILVSCEPRTQCDFFIVMISSWKSSWRIRFRVIPSSLILRAMRRSNTKRYWIIPRRLKETWLPEDLEMC